MHAKQSLVTVKDDRLDSAAVFDYGSGRLSYLCQNVLVIDLHPPHSWTYIATVANNEHWGTRPTRADLMAVLYSFRASESRRAGADLVHEHGCRSYAHPLTRMLRFVRRTLIRSLTSAIHRARLGPRGAIR
jgi:hypothetical protein